VPPEKIRLRGFVQRDEDEPGGRAETAFRAQELRGGGDLVRGERLERVRATATFGGRSENFSRMYTPSASSTPAM
jgi:hypothetical protein